MSVIKLKTLLQVLYKDFNKLQYLYFFKANTR